VRTALILVKRYLFAFACCVYLFTIGWVRGRNRALMAAICSHFGLETRTVELTLPEISIEALLGDPGPVRIPEPTPQDGNVSALESLVIAALTAASAPSRCFEIGTFDGRTALTLAANCANGARVFSLDLPADRLEKAALTLEHADRAYVDKPIVGARLRGRPEAQRVTQLLGDSATFDFTPYHGNMELVFVDGAHHYEYVMSDSRHALAMLPSGRGVILWHDYGGWPGVTRALNHLHATDPEFRDLRHIAGTSLVCLIRGPARDRVPSG
jgi:hypothetical protein